MKRIVKRGIAALLVAITLVFVPVNGYQNAITCHAAAETAMFYVLRALVEATTLSMGYSFQTQEDLDISTRGLESFIESYKDCDDWSEASRLTTLYNLLITKKIGDTLDMTAQDLVPGYTFIRRYLAGKFRASGSSYDSTLDVGMSDVSESFVPGVSVSYCKITDNVYRECLYDKNTLTTLTSEMSEGGGLFRGVYDSSLAEKYGYYKYWRVYYCTKDFTSKYILTCEPVNGVFKIRCLNKNDGSLTAGLAIGLRSYCFYQATPDSSVVRDTRNTGYYYDLSASAINKMFIDFPLYTSYSAYCAQAEIENSYATALPVVGSGSVSTALPDSVTVSQTPARTKEIEKTITEARKENPSITQDELDEAVAKAIAKANTTTDSPSDSSTTDSAALSDIIVSLGYIREIVQQFQKDWTDGSSALQRDVEDVRDNFTVIEGGGDSGSDPEDEDPKIWVPPLFFASRFLKPVMEYFGNPLSEITKFLNSILNSVKQLPQLFDKAGALYIGRIYSDMTNMVSYVHFIGQSISDLPKKIADLIEIPVLNPQEIVEALNEGLVFPNLPVELPEINIPAIEIPEIKIPEIKVPDVNVDFPAVPDYLPALNNILAAIQNIFVLDTAAVNVSAGKLTGLWDKHLPFIPRIQKIISGISFSDSYDYPVIKMQTPKNLRPYYGSDYIILFDGKDFKDYFVWTRGIVKMMLYVGFFYSLTKHFRVRFHIG